MRCGGGFYGRHAGIIAVVWGVCVGMRGWATGAITWRGVVLWGSVFVIHIAGFLGVGKDRVVRGSKYDTYVLHIPPRARALMVDGEVGKEVTKVVVVKL